MGCYAMFHCSTAEIIRKMVDATWLCSHVHHLTFLWEFDGVNIIKAHIFTKDTSMVMFTGVVVGRNDAFFLASSFQWEFQDPKMEVLYHIRPYSGVYPLTYGRWSFSDPTSDAKKKTKRSVSRHGIWGCEPRHVRGAEVDRWTGSGNLATKVVFQQNLVPFSVEMPFGNLKFNDIFNVATRRLTSPSIDHFFCSWNHQSVMVR